MTHNVDLRLQSAATYCGLVFMVGYLVFWAWLGHNIPPPSWGFTPEERLANYFQPYHSEIQAGMLGAAVLGIFYLPWAVQLSMMMRERSPMLANVELLSGAIQAWLLVECPAMWAEAVRISDSNPALADMLWHESFTLYEVTYLITTLGMVTAGLYTLTDKTESPIFPRWTGWLAVGGGLSLVPLSWMPYHDSGPLAVNGVWNFWVVYTWWLVWFTVFTYYMARNVRQKMAAKAMSPLPEQNPRPEAQPI